MTVTILHPLPIAIDVAASSAGAGHASVLTPDPREAFIAGAVPATIVLDLGAPSPIDTLFVGYTDAPAGSLVTAAFDGGPVEAMTPIAHSFRRAPLRHALIRLPAPRVAQRATLQLAGGGAIGVVAAGLALAIGSGYEQGSGRPISDPTRVERLLGGGLAIEAGVAAGGFAWTLPALTDDERDRLYALALDAGIGTTLLVAERIDRAEGANEALHWGTLTRLEPWARQQPGETKWALQVQDWA